MARGDLKEAERHRQYALRFERYLLDMDESLDGSTVVERLDNHNTAPDKDPRMRREVSD